MNNATCLSDTGPQEAADLTPKAVRQKADALSDQLEAVAVVWRSDEEGSWCATDRYQSSAISDAVDPVLWHEEFTRAETGGEIVAKPLEHGRCGVVVPVHHRAGRYLISCISHLTADDALCKLADSTVASQEATQTINELQEENESFAVQLSTDLEELSTLRSIVDKMSRTDPCGDELNKMVRRTLPSINEIVRAQCLAFVSAVDEDDPEPAEVSVRIGPQVAHEATILSAIQTYGQLALKHTLIRNWNNDDTPSEADRENALPGVQSLVIAPLTSDKRVLGWLVAINRVPAGSEIESSWQLASDEFGSGEATLLSATASIIAMQAVSLEALREKEQLLVSVVRSLVSAIEAKDPYTHGHSERVALYARRIAEEVGYHDNEVERLYLSSLLHDVGKIGVSDATLLKEGKLTDEEYKEICRHPDEGWAILCDLQQLSYVLPGVLHHHERWDGKGYPDGLAERDIPLDARVLAVADAYDAMTSDRPYRKGMPNDKAEHIIREGSGTQWDPECVEAFFQCLDELHQIQSSYIQHERAKRVPGAEL